MPSDSDSFREAQLALFRASVLKQRKWRELSRAAGPTIGLDALDLGSDNGVISYLFREGGGQWDSADLTAETVRAIERMVGERVALLEPRCNTLPYSDAAFDLIVVVDLLEHVADDRALMRDIARCLRPGGRAILNVPNLKRRALLPKARHALGLTDAWHGHLHAGYDRAALDRLLPAELRLVRGWTYSRSFSHALDSMLNVAYLQRTRDRSRPTAKGTVVTGESAGTSGARTLRRLYPAMRAFAALDALLPFAEGFMRIAVLEKQPRSAS